MMICQDDSKDILHDFLLCLVSCQLCSVRIHVIIFAGIKRESVVFLYKPDDCLLLYLVC